VARAMSIRHTIVPSAERDEFRDRAGRSSKHYSAAGCNYWLFEESALPGAYVEFFEAPDPETLQRAHNAAPQPILESARMYVEVELS
jgi:hypothetical protein